MYKNKRESQSLWYMKWNGIANEIIIIILFTLFYIYFRIQSFSWIFWILIHICQFHSIITKIYWNEIENGNGNRSKRIKSNKIALNSWRQPMGLYHIKNILHLEDVFSWLIHHYVYKFKARNSTRIFIC